MSTNPGQVQETLQRIGNGVFKRKKELPVILRGSNQWSEWRRWRVDNGLPVAFMDRQERWTVPLEYPPLDLGAAETEYAQGSSIAGKFKSG